MRKRFVKSAIKTALLLALNQNYSKYQKCSMFRDCEIYRRS